MKGLLHSVQPIALENALYIGKNRYVDNLWILKHLWYKQWHRLRYALLVGSTVNDHENVNDEKGCRDGALS